MFKYLIVLLLVIIALFSGCVSDKEQFRSLNHNETLILYGDNTFILSNPAKYDVSGAYRVDTGNLVLIFSPFGNTYTLKIKRDGLVDPKDGEEWVKI